MDLKKITALAMLALMVIPSLTMVVRADDPTVDPDDGAGLADAIARARLYLGKVRILADNIDVEDYPDNDKIQGYLDEIYDLLGQEWEEGPEILLQAETYGIAEFSEVKSHSETYSVHLETTGTPGDGDEAKIIILMPTGFTLGDLVALSWWEYLVAGYPPHVDVYLDMGDELVFEYACNNDMTGSGTGHYGAETGAWFSTFNDNPSGLSQIADTAKAWANSGPPGGPDQVLFTLAEWKAGQTYTTDVEYTINSESIVTKLEIEVDNWIVQTEAYVDDIKINEDVYDFEEEHEGLGAEGFLDRASTHLGEDDFNSAARNLAAARNILGRVKGLLNGIAKAHKVTRIERFMEQVRLRINGIVDKIDKLSGRLGAGKGNNVKAAMGRALGNIPQPGEATSEDPEITTASISAALTGMDGDILDFVEAIDRLEAKIRVLRASAERLSRKDCDTTAVIVELEDAEDLLKGIVNLLVEGEEGYMEDAENLLEQAEDLVSEANSMFRGIRKEHQNKGSKGKGKGQGN